MRPLFGLALLLGACAGSGVNDTLVTTPLVLDADGDGISDEDEIAQGLDPNAADSDADGLDDGEELALGTNPLDEDTDDDWLLDGEESDHGTDELDGDTDGDRYLDGDEVLEGTDPLDPTSRIYQGGWPYNHEKDSVNSGSWQGTLSIDEKFGPLVTIDQHGEEVDFFDWSGKHQTYKHIVVDASAEWCGPCQATSLWLGGGADYYNLEPSYGALRSAVDNWEMAWITILTQENGGGAARPVDCQEWDSQYPHPNVAVVHDVGGAVEYGIIGVTNAFPSGALLKARTMKVQAIDTMVPALLGIAQNEL